MLYFAALVVVALVVTDLRDLPSRAAR